MFKKDSNSRQVQTLSEEQKEVTGTLASTFDTGKEDLRRGHGLKTRDPAVDCRGSVLRIN